MGNYKDLLAIQLCQPNQWVKNSTVPGQRTKTPSKSSCKFKNVENDMSGLVNI